MRASSSAAKARLTFRFLSGSLLAIHGAEPDIEDTGIQISEDEVGGDGKSPNASVTVDNAALTVNSGNAFIRVGNDGQGKLTVQNNGSALVAGSTGYGSLVVGSDVNGAGVLDVPSGGQVTLTSGVGNSSLFVAERAGGTGIVTVDGTGQTRQTLLDAGELLAIGYRDVSTGEVGGTGAVSVRNGGVVEATDVVISPTGFLGGNGTVRGNITNNGGTMAAGLSPGTLNIVGDYTQNDGFLEVEIAGLVPGEFDVYSIDGVANFLGGSILFIFVDDFLPKTSDVVNFLFADEILGLSNITFQYQGAAPGFEFNVVDDGSGGLQFVALNDAIDVPEPASMALFGAGLLGLGLLSRRKRLTT